MGEGGAEGGGEGVVEIAEGNEDGTCVENGIALGLA